MSANLSLPGINTSHNEVTNISSKGFWLLFDDREYFVPFAEYPVFMKGSVEQIFAVQRLSSTQFHWPDLDADIESDALEEPNRYPLTWKD